MSSEDIVESAADKARRRRGERGSWRLPKRTIIALLVLTSVCAASWTARVTLLQEAAELWIVDDPVQPSDVAVVLGGGLDTRPFAAAKLYHRGLVKRIIVSQVPDDPPTKLGITTPHTELNIAVLEKLGVPASAIGTFGEANDNTEEEAVTLKKWIEDNKAASVIVPTEIFSSRRVQWSMHHELAASGVRVTIEALEPINYRRVGWWRNEQGVIAFQNEVLKYLYYRLKY